MLLLCCNVLSLAEGGSTTVVVGGFHLPHCCHCRPCESRVCRRQLDRSNWIEGTPRRSESETIAEVHENGDPLSRIFWDSLVYPQAVLPTSAAANTVALHHPACCAFGVFFFSLFHRARRRLCGLLAPYYSPWLRVLASLRSTFALYVQNFSFFNTLARRSGTRLGSPVPRSIHRARRRLCGLLAPYYASVA